MGLTGVPPNANSKQGAPAEIAKLEVAGAARTVKKAKLPKTQESLHLGPEQGIEARYMTSGALSY
jgi:hypothetical protein